MRAAIDQARLFIGATSPNPPVGAAALDSSGRILSVQAHEKAGTPHAEAKVIADCEQRGLAIHTLLVTLEPCNHHGRTPPCTEAILRARIDRVIYGAADPNPKATGGAERLNQAGVEATLAGGKESRQCAELLRPFKHWVSTGLPWVTIKTAHDSNGSMIPPAGLKTFTSASSLKLAHELRKRADAILTGSGTILADLPEFTVRHVPDHAGKIRWLVFLDRRKRVPGTWLKQAEARGFKLLRALEVEGALRFLGSQGVLEVLVEAGPTLTKSILEDGLWNEHVRIRRANPDDQIEIILRSPD